MGLFFFGLRYDFSDSFVQECFVLGCFVLTRISDQLFWSYYSVQQRIKLCVVFSKKIL